MVSIAPSISASFMRVTWIGIVLRCLARPNPFLYHGTSRNEVTCASLKTSKR
jgi:hypothetical protein